MEEKKKKDEASFSKRLMFEELEKEFKASENAFFSRFDRLTVADMSELRRNLEKVSTKTRVVKHTLAKKILEKTKWADASRFLDGSILVTLGAKEPQLVSKTLVDFIKTHENVELKGMILEGLAYDASFVKQLAKLPSRKDLLTQVAVGLKSPITRLAVTLKGIVQSLVIALNEVHKKKSSEAPQQG